MHKGVRNSLTFTYTQTQVSFYICILFLSLCLVCLSRNKNIRLRCIYNILAYCGERQQICRRYHTLTSLSLSYVGVVKRTSCDRRSRTGDALSIHYTAWTRQSGQVYDSSLLRGYPFEFTLGKGTVCSYLCEGLFLELNYQYSLNKFPIILLLSSLIHTCFPMPCLIVLS